MKDFFCLRVLDEKSPVAQFYNMNEADLFPGNVTIQVHYSGLNFKDALAITGKGRILKNFPLNVGIDAAGTVLQSDDARFRPGEKVLVNGCGLGETTDGGLSEILRVSGDVVVPLPDGLSLREAMILGTAGFTAALAMERMEQNGQTPSLGPILITGASGGVGSFAVQLFAQKGYEVHAVSAKPEAVSYLKKLGATSVLTPAALALGAKPLEGVRFGGAVDNVGGELLARVLAHTQLWGNVASIGLAGSHELHTTVMPFILRGVSLLGASSNNCPRELRHKLWQRLGDHWRPKQIDSVVSRSLKLKDAIPAAQDLLDRKIQGRILVEVQ